MEKESKPSCETSRLVKSARYSRGTALLHMARDNLEEFGLDTLWERAAERIKTIDPDGRRSLALLRRMGMKKPNLKGKTK